MALTTALTFLLLSAGVLCARPHPGVMAMITSDSAGGATARRLLPAAILVPLALGGLRLWGQKKGFFGAEIGLSLVVVSSMAAFAGLIWWNAKLLHRADGDRKRVERRLTVQYTTARVLAESPTLEEAIRKILQTICETLGWQMGGMWNVDTRSNSLNCVEVWHSPGADTSEFEMMTRQSTFPPGVGLPGRVWTSGEPAWIADVVEDADFPRAPLATKVGLHGGFGFPIRRGNEVLGVMEFFSSKIEQPDADLLQMLAAIGSQIGQFIERKGVEEWLQGA